MESPEQFQGIFLHTLSQGIDTNIYPKSPCLNLTMTRYKVDFEFLQEREETFVPVILNFGQNVRFSMHTEGSIVCSLTNEKVPGLVTRFDFCRLLYFSPVANLTNRCQLSDSLLLSWTIFKNLCFTDFLPNSLNFSSVTPYLLLLPHLTFLKLLSQLLYQLSKL